MMTESMIYEKIQDLLTREARAAEIYREALKHAESTNHQETITLLLNDELRHVRMVRAIFELI